MLKIWLSTNYCKLSLLFEFVDSMLLVRFDEQFFRTLSKYFLGDKDGSAVPKRSWFLVLRLCDPWSSMHWTGCINFKAGRRGAPAKQLEVGIIVDNVWPVLKKYVMWLCLLTAARDCPPNSFRCITSGACVDDEGFCDGWEYDCPDNSDEQTCATIGEYLQFLVDFIARRMIG